MIGDWKMDLVPRERLGVFLISTSLWYLINIKIFNALDPILAIPGSIIFVAGLWLLLSLPIPTTETSTYVPVEIPEQVATEPVAEATPIPASKPTRKTNKKPKQRSIKKT